MTLVVSEASSAGIVMVGDSALTVRTTPVKTYSGIAKVQYSPAANVGLAMWGSACVAGDVMDTWLARFLPGLLSTDTVETVAEKLATDLNAALSTTGRPWNELRRGIHVAGFIEGVPHIYHVHTGGDPTNQHEMRVFKDYPYGVGHTPASWPSHIALRPEHIRNGYYQMFGGVFDGLEQYFRSLPSLGLGWPTHSLEDRCHLVRLQVAFVAHTLKAAGRHAAVDDDLSYVGFTASGLKIDGLRSPVPIAICGTADELIL